MSGLRTLRGGTGAVCSAVGTLGGLTGGGGAVAHFRIWATWMKVLVVGEPAIVKGGNSFPWLRLQEYEHVIGCLSEVVGVGDLGEGDERWEPLDSESVMDAGHARDVTFETVVMFEGRSNITAFDAMGCKGGALRRWLVDEDASAGRC